MELISTAKKKNDVPEMHYFIDSDATVLRKKSTVKKLDPLTAEIPKIRGNNLL